MTLASLLCLLFPAMAILAAVYDARSMTIPNWISIVLAISYVPVAFIVGLPMADIGWSVGIGFIALVLGIALFAFRILGGGDAKLLAASAMWVGLSGLLPFLLYTALAGGALSLFLLLARKWMPLMPVVVGPQWMQRLLEPKGDIPYGIAIAVAAVLVYPQTALVLASIAMA